jgi:hypothetical protein
VIDALGLEAKYARDRIFDGVKPKRKIAARIIAGSITNMRKRVVVRKSGQLTI